MLDKIKSCVWCVSCHSGFTFQNIVDCFAFTKVVITTRMQYKFSGLYMHSLISQNNSIIQPRIFCIRNKLTQLAYTRSSHYLYFIYLYMNQHDKHGKSLCFFSENHFKLKYGQRLPSIGQRVKTQPKY